MFTFAFGLTTAGLDHLNSFDSMAQSEAQGTSHRLLKVAATNQPCPLKQINAALTERDQNSMPMSLLVGSELRHVPDVITTATATRSSRWFVLKVGRIWLCSGEGSDRRGIWPGTLGGNDGFTHVSENEPGEYGTDKEVFDLAD